MIPAAARSSRFSHLVIATLACALLASCGGEGSSEPEPEPQPPSAPSFEWIKRDWQFSVRAWGESFNTLGDPGLKLGTGIVDDERIVGGLLLKPAGVPDGARVEVYSSDDGVTYWVGTQVPAGRFDDPTRIESTRTEYNQYQYFIKTEDNASLSFTISQALIEVMDSNPDLMPRPITDAECPERSDTMDCAVVVNGWVSLIVRAYNYDTSRDFFERSSYALLGGVQKDWSRDAGTNSGAGLWEFDQFEFNEDVGGQGTGDHATWRLREPVVVQIPLTDVGRGDMFVVHSNAIALALDVRHRETYAAAFLRDPQSSGGLAMQFTGLTPVDDPGLQLPAYVEPPAPPCAGGATAAAGELQFEAAQFSVSEQSALPGAVYVTRTGGTQGAVSAWLTTQDDSARAGTHYTSVATHVAFADGQGGRRLVQVPVMDDDVAERGRTVRLLLADARGCATLGDRAEAVLTIHDDDTPPVVDPVYTVYVTVTGLAGQGLAIEDSITGANITPTTDGTQALGYPYHSGMNYNVRVHTQPGNPDQSCTVNNASGVIGDTDVTNVSVICRTLAPSGDLDLSFGVQGKVYAEDLAHGRGVVVQRSGRIVVLTDMQLAAFHADGSVDEGFGTSGRESFVFNGGIGEESYGLAIQDDDKLVVVGRARNGNRYDMAVARFNADGSRDTGFGTAGLTTLNRYQIIRPQDGVIGSSYANRALITGDGKIYVAGVASWTSVSAENNVNFAVARLNADGTPDTMYAAGIGESAAITGEPDIAYGLGLQSDGKLVVTGHADNSQGVGMARFKTNGLLDTDDPRVPENYGRDGSGLVLFDTAPHGALSGARDLVMLEDDSVIVAAAVRVAHPTLGGVAKIEMLHVTPQGTIIAGDDYVMTSLGPDNDVVQQLIRQPDGKVLLVAQASSPTTVADFGVVRYNEDLTLDRTFGADGVVLVDFYAARDGASAVALAPDGGIIVVGSVRNGSREQFGMVRIAQ
jgi:uncharacterized delta-60 repeat protein